MAHDLIGAGLDVVVLESGGEQWEPRTQALAEGTVSGERFRFNGNDVALTSTRMRQLGGSSNHWTGQCRPLDAHDLAARPATADLGWPFALDTLEPWYRQAGETVELMSEEWDPAWWHDETGASLLPTDDRIRSVVFQFSPPTRFAERLGPAVRRADDLRVFLWANAVELVTDRAGSTVQSVRVATLDGPVFSVEAATVVLATGGIDVPRLLLASTGASPSGVGNENDLVGRFFMEHPHVIGGRAWLTIDSNQLAPYLIGPRSGPGGATGLTWFGLSPTVEIQAAEAIANGCILVWPDGDGPPRGERDADARSSDAVRDLLAGGPIAPVPVTLSVRTEQVPNPESRVVLHSDRDELGVPRADVQWRLSELDHRTIRRTVELVAESVGAAGLGRIEIDPAGRPIEQWPVEIGNHHMGTTRMHADPAVGVVDADGRMHEVTNLYVCGSSVFPTTGMANPTLTVVALAHRLAAHLRRDLAATRDDPATPLRAVPADPTPERVAMPGPGPATDSGIVPG